MLLSSLIDRLPSTLGARVLNPAPGDRGRALSGRVTDSTRDVREGDVFVAQFHLNFTHSAGRHHVKTKKLMSQKGIN